MAEVPPQALAVQLLIPKGSRRHSAQPRAGAGLLRATSMAPRRRLTEAGTSAAAGRGRHSPQPKAGARRRRRQQAATTSRRCSAAQRGRWAKGACRRRHHMLSRPRRTMHSVRPLQCSPQQRLLQNRRWAVLSDLNLFLIASPQETIALHQGAANRCFTANRCF